MRTSNTPPGFRRTSNGRLEYRFTYDRVRYSIVCDDVPEGIARQKELIAELAQNGYIPNKKITFEQYFNEFIESWRYTVKGSTVTHLNSISKRFLPELGKYRMRDIEDRQLQQFYDGLIDKEGLSIASASVIFSKVSMIFRDAVLRRVITHNPCDLVKKRKADRKKAVQTIHRALTIEEEIKFKEAIKGLWLEYFLLFMLHSGVRCGEAGALEWSNVDFEKEEIHIVKTITLSDSGVPVIGDTTKSEAGRRDIPMTDDLREILEEQKERTEMIDGELGKMVFPARFGEFVIHQSVDIAIVQALRKMEGVPRFTSHCLRDTYATRMIESGADPKEVQELLGHSSLTMTFSYVHPDMDSKRKAMENMEKARKKIQKEVEET